MDLNAILSGVLGGGLISAFLGALALRENRTTNTREALFKCLDAYYKVMDYQTKAEESSKASAYYTYYRSLFDLHWAEYQIWLRDAIADPPYRAWLNARFHDYEASVDLEPSSKLVPYRGVWEDLLKKKYFIDDDFISHMELVHKGKFSDAMNQKYQMPQSFMSWPVRFRRLLNQ